MKKGVYFGLCLLAVAAAGRAEASAIVQGATYLGRVAGQSGTYDYAPSIIQDGSIYRMYWCSGVAGDGILYATSSDRINWGPPQVVLTAAAYSAESAYASIGHVCDPSVVKVGSTYYMYYTAAAATGPSSGVNNQIFLATSADGITWTKYPSNSNPQPVIPNTVNSYQYGIGQSVVMYLRGKFYQYYTNTDAGGILLAFSTNGINWTVQNGGAPVLQTPFVPTYLQDYGMFFAVAAKDELTNDGLYYSYSFDGLQWLPTSPDSSKKLAVGGGRGSAHNAGILGNAAGVATGSSVYVYYGAGASGFQTTTWEIDLTRIDLRRISDIYVLNRNGAITTDLAILHGADAYQKTLFQTTTALAPTGSDGRWAFAMGDHNRDGVMDLYAIKKVLGSTGTTEVHVLNGADRFQTLLLQTGTSLAPSGTNSSWVFDVGDYNLDGQLDLYCIAKASTGTNTTEVHVLNGANNFQTWLLHAATPQGVTGSDDAWNFKLGDYNLDGRLDLYSIKKTATASNTTELHILNGANNFQSWLLQSSTGFGVTGSDNSTMFVLGDYDGDGAVDVHGVAKTATGSGRTEVHSVSRATGFQGFVVHSPTPYGLTGTDLSWVFLGR